MESTTTTAPIEQTTPVAPSTTETTSSSSSSSSSAAAASGNVTDLHLIPSIYVGDLLPDVNEENLFEAFGKIGRIFSIRVLRDYATGRSLGYAYVNFERQEDADSAISNLNYSLIKGRPCRVSPVRHDPTTRRLPDSNVFVKNLPKTFTAQKLTDLFSKFGKIISCKIEYNRKNISRGFGFVQFEAPECARNAIAEMNDFELEPGFKIEVVPFKSYADRLSEGTVLPPEKTFTRIYIKNIPEDFTGDEFRALFGQCGEIISFSLPHKSGGFFGFCNYKTHEAAQRAVDELDKKEVKGRVLSISRAYTEYERIHTQNRKYRRYNYARHKFPPHYGMAAQPHFQQMPPQAPQQQVQQVQQVIPQQVQQQQQQQRRQAAPQQQQVQQGGIVPQKGGKGQHNFSNTNLYVSNLDKELTEEALAQIFEKFGGLKSVKVIRDVNGESRGFGYVSYFAPQDAQQAAISTNNTCIIKNAIQVSFARYKKKYVNGKKMAPAHNQQQQQQRMDKAPQQQQQVPPPQQQQQEEEKMEEEEKGVIGEFLFKIAFDLFNDEGVSGKVTGMILDSLRPSELRALKSNEEMAKAKIAEAKNFLDMNQK